MSKLVFYYGTMGCSKTANALMMRFQYLERNKSVILIKPAVDTRDDDKSTGTFLIKSRIGIQAEAIVVGKGIKDLNIFEKYLPDIIICDEAQFLTPRQVEVLKNLSTKIDVFCYGLKTDFQTKLFPGSKRLLELADEIREIESVCSCGNKAIVNARLDASGNVLVNGSQIDIGGNEKYRAMCWSCYLKGIHFLRI